MVLKLRSFSANLSEEFENDVIWYGTQTTNIRLLPIVAFENDVIWYGTQTYGRTEKIVLPFENDVIWYGTQTPTDKNKG